MLKLQNFPKWTRDVEISLGGVMRKFHKSQHKKYSMIHFGIGPGRVTAQRFGRLLNQDFFFSGRVEPAGPSEEEH